MAAASKLFIDPIRVLASCRPCFSKALAENLCSWSMKAMNIESSSVNNVTVASKKKVLFLGIDGVQFQRLNVEVFTNFARLKLRRAYAGGVIGQLSQQDTWSGPGWATLLTGVWVSRHGIVNNGSGHANRQYPTVFKRIREGFPSAIMASYISWSPIMDSFFHQEKPLINEAISQLSDQAVTDKIVARLGGAEGADFIFGHFSDPDNAGHSHGYGPEYDRAMETADRQLGQILDALQRRMHAHLEEDWLFIVSTDHGRTASGWSHGGHSELEKTAFIGVLGNAELNDGFLTPVTDMENQEMSGLYGCPSQACVAPTILRHLGLYESHGAGMEGIPLIGELGVQALMLSSDKKALVWSSQSSALVNIKGSEGTSVSVPANTRRWPIPAAHPNEASYTFTLGHTATRLHAKLHEVRSALDWSSDRAYIFLSEGYYSRYNTQKDHAEGGYPLKVANSLWPGLEPFVDRLIGGVSQNERVAFLFLSDGKYLRYDKVNDRVDPGYPKAISDATWPGMGPFAGNLRTALRWTGDFMFFFLKNGTYLKYDFAKDAVDQRQNYPLSTAKYFPGLGPHEADMTGAVKFNDRYAFIFLKDRRYLRYNIREDKVDAGYPRAVDDTSWPGLLSGFS